MRLWASVGLIAGIVAAAGTAQAQNRVPRGDAVLAASVKDAHTRKGLTAEVWIRDVTRLARADQNGSVRITDVPPGVHRVRVRMFGYSAAEVDIPFVGRDTVAVEFLLYPIPVLEPVEVKAAAVPAYLRHFEIRRKIGAGRYLRETDLVRDGDRLFEDVAVSKFPGLRRVIDADGRNHLASTRGSCGYQNPRIGMNSGTGSCFSNKPCLIQMYLDDMLLAEEDFDLIRTWDLAAVEYYTGASMPPRYRITGSACGVILLWTKRYDKPGSSPN